MQKGICGCECSEKAPETKGKTRSAENNGDEHSRQQSQQELISGGSWKHAGRALRLLQVLTHLILVAMKRSGAPVDPFSRSQN